MTTDTATIDTRTNIGGTAGTGTIISTITIEIMIGTTTGIDALLILFSNDKFRRVTARMEMVGLRKTDRKVSCSSCLWQRNGIEAYEIITFCPCAGFRRIDFSIV